MTLGHLVTDIAMRGEKHSKLQIQNYSGELKNMNVEKYRKCKRQKKMK